MSALRIAWLTPWNLRSAIALSSFAVASELERRGHEVTVFRTETGHDLELAALPATREIQRLSDWPAQDVRRHADVVVAQIGDHFGFHGALLSKLPELDAVGIFHDAFLANLAYCWAEGDESTLRNLTAQIYGADAWPVAEPYLRDLGEVMKSRPMLEWLAHRTTAAVAHAEHYAPRLRRSCPGPVAVIPLAFICPDLPPPPSVWDRMTIATIGNANANKRIDQIILAIASSHMLRTCCRVKVVGMVTGSERARLERLASLMGIAPPEFTGWVADEDLPWHLRNVDVISCLRNPVLEGASASLIVAMWSKRPTLVTDHGCYAEMPDDTLMKCSPDREAVDAMRHLERMLRDPSRFSAMGERAHEVVVRLHAPPSAYVDALLPVLRQIAERRPVMEASRSLASTLACFGLQSEDPAAKRIRDVLTRLITTR